MHHPETGVKRHQIAPRYDQACLSQLEFDSASNQAICEWVKAPKNFMVIEGSPGIGKTYLCAALVNKWHKEGKELRYFTGNTFLEKIRRGFDEKQEQNLMVRQICETNILIIDDFGTNLSNTPWQSEIIFELLDNRYGYQLPTVITTNLTPDEVSELFTQRARSRLYAKENLYIKLGASDRREPV